MNCLVQKMWKNNQTEVPFNKLNVLRLTSYSFEPISKWLFCFVWPTSCECTMSLFSWHGNCSILCFKLTSFLKLTHSNLCSCMYLFCGHFHVAICPDLAQKDDVVILNFVYTIIAGQFILKPEKTAVYMLNTRPLFIHWTN